MLSYTKGYRMTKNRLFKVAHEAYLHAFDYAYHGRKRRKRDMRRLWINRINITLRSIDPKFKYSLFVNRAAKTKLALNRKMLADIAVKDPSTFETIAKSVFK